MTSSDLSIKDLLAGVRRLRRGIDPPNGSDQASNTGRRIAARLDASVIRPLATLLGEHVDEASSNDDDGSSHDGVWELTKRATELRCQRDAAPLLIEATAALLDLACTGAIFEEKSEPTQRLEELRQLYVGLESDIRVSHNGPLLVTNAPNVFTWFGERLPPRPQLALCRCGGSAMKPYCDGSHAANGFDDAKDLKRVPDRADTYVGQQVTVIDNRGTCQHSGFCTDRLPTVFRTNTEPFVAPSGGRMDEIVRAVRDCPSGALSYAIDGIEARPDVDWHDKREPTIDISKDGPYRVTGSIALRDDAGSDVTQNDAASREHYALCRCGHSKNKPFCSGMHWNVGFTHPTRGPNVMPTVFEWAGGLPALTRMTRLFYEKFVPADDLLAPLFANMSVDHPQRVAKWLGEVFCGPTCYSDEYGGYSRMISQHLGKCLTEEMRARWVALLLQAAREANLPNDAEFRSTFQAYIEWGSRLAVENSQTEAKPPLHMPMPHWDWTTSAGAPGVRVSALAPPEESDVILPGPEERVEFGKHVKGLFRERDRKSMQFAFDLGSYADVNKHADSILERVRNGTMPCDGAWPKEKVEVFARWVAGGKPE